MFKKLKKRWQVNEITFLLILCTFAFGGSLCGFTARKLLDLIKIENQPLKVILYIFLLTLLWPFCVLAISIPLGQFSFFITYLKKMLKRMTGNKTTDILVAVFASGAGSNAEKIVQYLRSSAKRGNGSSQVGLIVCNKPEAGVLKVAAQYGIKTLLIDKERFFKGDGYVTELNACGIQFIVLAGFLWKVPVSLIRAYPGKIVNIHPALLPKYGGKGMYGSKVHAAVIAAEEKESGITIHYVDELYDHGNIIFQASCPVDQNDTPDTLAKKSICLNISIIHP